MRQKFVRKSKEWSVRPDDVIKDKSGDEVLCSMRRNIVLFTLFVSLALVTAGCSLNSLVSTGTDLDALELLHDQGETDPFAEPEPLPIVEDELEDDGEVFISSELFALTVAEELQGVSAQATGQRATVQKGWLRKGSSFETPYYVITAPEPGPTLMVVGGVHGNEPAGFAAAERIVRELRPDRGRLIVVPRANAPATRRRTRGVSSVPDLNRRFPLGRSPIGQVANELYALVKEYDPDWFVDLHEGYDYHIVNKRSVGQSVIVYPTGTALADARALVNHLNSMPAVTKKRTKRFTLIRNPVQGSIARKVGQELRIPSAIVETVTKDPLERRVGFQIQAVQFIASRIGMKLE